MQRFVNIPKCPKRISLYLKVYRKHSFLFWCPIQGHVTTTKAKLLQKDRFLQLVYMVGVRLLSQYLCLQKDSLLHS